MQAISEQFLQSINCFKDQTKFGSIKFLILQSLYCAKSTTNGQENFCAFKKKKVGERLWGAGPESLRKHLAGNFCTIAQILSCVPRNLKYKRLQKDQLRQVSSQEKTYFSALKLRILESINGRFILADSAFLLQNK